MAFEDRTLKCKDCGKDFVFTSGEQQFYAEKGFENEPVRCKDCRDVRKRSRDGGGASAGPREMYDAVCAQCGAETQVPFKPRNDRPILCRDCFTSSRG
ncbi:MAG: zinc-ribbon domain containing protein [Negativicutes bacterium]